MNANQMADALAEVPIEIFGKVRMIDVRTMLRQQAKEIEMLRQGMKDGFDGLETMTALSKAQADQITRLKLEWQYMYDRANMDSTNKPVAWIDEETGCFVYSQYDYEDLDEHGKDGLIPLYTHPVKELTDEEIIKTMVQFDVYSNDDQCLIEAGRAILRKAQEK